MKFQLWIVVLFLGIFLFPLATARITLSDPPRSQYNIGDTLSLTGFILENDDVSGKLQVVVHCNNQNYPTHAVPVSLKGGEEASLSSLSIPSVMFTSSMQGLCSIVVNLEQNNVVLDTATTGFFEITNALKAKFDIDRNQLQLGDTITIGGQVEALDGSPLSGTAEVFFVQENIEYVVGVTPIDNGILQFPYTFTKGFAGAYSININVRDSYGNEQRYENVASFEVLEGLYVFAKTNQNTILPGEALNIFGTVKTLTQSSVSSGSVEILLDDLIHSTTLADSQYTYDLWIPATIKSGDHTLTINVIDSYGNEGKTTTKIDVIPKPTLVKIVIENGTVAPREDLSIKTFLYDQAADLMDGTLTLTLSDPKGKDVGTYTRSSGDSWEYIIPQFATPGLWRWNLAYSNGAEEPLLTDTSQFKVSEVKELETLLDGHLLYVRNIGNVPYTDDIKVSIDGISDYMLTKTRDLDVNESITIDLEDEVPNGQYHVTLPTGFGVAEVGDVEIINGKVERNISWLYTGLAILFIALLLYLIYLRIHARKEWKRKNRYSSPGFIQPTSRMVSAVKKKASIPKKSSLTFEDPHENVEDFKKRTLEEIKRVEEQQKQPKPKFSATPGKLAYLTGRTEIYKTPEKKQESQPFFLFED